MTCIPRRHTPSLFLAWLGALALAGASSPARGGALGNPASEIGFPLPGAVVPARSPVGIAGRTESDGIVTRVQVSTDGGASWVNASGTSPWSLSWTPQAAGDVVLVARAFAEDGTIGPVSRGDTVHVTAADPPSCPCTLWPLGTVPSDTDDGATTPLEVGVRFHSDVDGVIGAIRFFKAIPNLGHHEVHLWTAGGERLGSASMDTAYASGWQEVPFDPPIPVARDSDYVASVFMPQSRYAVGSSYFFMHDVDRPPLHAPRDGAGGRNGLYSYGAAPSFPDSSFISSNYWIDVRFDTTPNDTDTTRPRLVAIRPLAGEPQAPVDGAITATFSEPMDPSSLGDSSFVVRDDAGVPVRASVTYLAAGPSAILTPVALAYAAHYTVELTAAVRDRAGNPLASPARWSFHTPSPPNPPGTDGPGGPVLVLASTANRFTRYVPEILRAEGLNEFAVREMSTLDPGLLDTYAVAIVGEMSLDSAAVATLADWVARGGRLIALRPDPRLSALAGLTGPSGTLSDAYLDVVTDAAPGAGIVGQTMQYHGPADCYDLAPGAGARAVAWLYRDASQPTLHPAVTWRDVGGAGGAVAVFTYDLARSVVYTRQGNPAWSGEQRDGVAPRRATDLYWGAADFDPQPDWVDATKRAIPQADEQQRLLVNLLLAMTADRAPLPRFWYFPRGLKAALVMTGDDHGSEGVVSRFDQLAAASDPGCVPEDWECVRGTTYLYTGPPLTDEQARAYQDAGFEIAIHVFTGCKDRSASEMDVAFASDRALFADTYPSVRAPVSNRTHCAAWPDFSSEADVEANHGIRLDSNYYYFPEEWVRGIPGMFTGSGLPMRFARADGSLVDCYQSPTIFTDDAHDLIPQDVDHVLDHAVGPDGWYGAFNCNFHFVPDSDHVVAAALGSAKAHGVPVISAAQLLTWTDARAASTISDIAWADGALSFTVTAAAAARHLQALVPAVAHGDTLRSLMRDGSPLAFTRELQKGVLSARFEAASGAYVAFYSGAALVGAPAAGPRFAFDPVAPNPSRSDVRFTFETPAPGAVRVHIFDVRGRLVRTLARPAGGAGRDALPWDRLDRAGRRVAPGVYLARLEAAGQSRVRRVVLLR